MKNKNTIQKNKGAAMMIVVLFFMFISLTILIGIVTPVVREFRIASDNFSSKKAYFLAESGSEDAYYRIKNGKQISTSESLSIGDDTTTTTITTISNNQKEISSTGDSNDNQRKSTLMLSTGAGVAFNYGIQSGNGGFSMSGGSKISGNIYSNGSINATTGVVITGSAVAADSALFTPDQINEVPTVPTNSILFRNTTTPRDFAQSFKLSTSGTINRIDFYLKKLGVPSDATINIYSDNNGSPGSLIDTGVNTLNSGQVTGNYGWIPVVFAKYPTFSANTSYWVVITNSTQNASNYYIIAASNTYVNGTAKTGSNKGAWGLTNLDGYFRLYKGGASSLIGGSTDLTGVHIGSNGIGDAWATVIKGADVAGKIFCTYAEFINNNKLCDSSKGTPPSLPMPFSDANIDEWKTKAESGGTINGNYTVGWADGTLGNKKITGNLTVDGGGTLTLTGTLWVVGTVTITSGGNISLPPNYAKNSETIVSDNKVVINGGGSAGSGTLGSYLFIVSTSKCPNDTYCGGDSAITVTGGAGAIAVDAQNGAVSLSGGTTLNAVVGNSITMSGGGEVKYDQGLASPSFKSGPSGGWNLDSWKETQ